MTSARSIEVKSNITNSPRGSTNSPERESVYLK